MFDSKSIANTLVQFVALLCAISFIATLHWYYLLMDNYGMEEEFLCVLLVEFVIVVICCLASHGLQKNRRVYLLPFYMLLSFKFAWALIYTFLLISDIVGLIAISGYQSIEWARNCQFSFFAAQGCALLYFYFLKVFTEIYVQMGKHDSKQAASLSKNFHYIHPKIEVC